MFIEAARAYGASDARIIFLYLIHRMIPLLIPGLVLSVPSFVFLNRRSQFSAWVIQSCQRGGRSLTMHYKWRPLQRILLLDFGAGILFIIAGLGFAMLGFALDRIFNPRLRDINQWHKTIKSSVIEELVLYLNTTHGPVQAVDGVNFELTNRAVSFLVNPGAAKVHLQRLFCASSCTHGNLFWACVSGWQGRYAVE